MAKSLAVMLSSLKMAVATFCSRILGLVREQVMAHMFGASDLTDAFLVAFRIPNLMRDLFAEGAFSSAFVPTFTEANGISREEAQLLLWRLFIILVSVTGVITIFTIVEAPFLIKLFAPTFALDPHKFEITVTLTRIMAPFLTFVSVAALFMGALNSMKVFFIPSLAPAFLNVVMIASMFFFPSWFLEIGIEPIYALGYGVLIGGFVQALVQFPLLFKFHLGPLIPQKLWGDREKKVLKMLGPGLMGFAASQINLLINTILASSTVVGAVSWLSYSFRLFQLPVGILSVSIGNSNLVHFSDSWKAHDEEKAIGFLKSSFFLSFFVILPATICLYLFADEMVNVIYERGKFDAESTLMTAKALRWYAIGLPCYGLYKILVPVFYVIERQKVPVYCSFISIAINIVFCLSLTPIWGFEVLAFGTTLSMLVNTALLLFMLRKDLKIRLSKFIDFRILKLFLASLISFVTAQLFKIYLGVSGDEFIWRILNLSLGLGVILIAYLVSVLALGEKAAVQNFLKSRQKKR